MHHIFLQKPEGAPEEAGTILHQERNALKLFTPGNMSVQSIWRSFQNCARKIYATIGVTFTSKELSLNSKISQVEQKKAMGAKWAFRLKLTQYPK
jgi:hypothetical protein